MHHEEELLVAITRSRNLLSGDLRIVEEYGLNTPPEWIGERMREKYLDRRIFIIRGRTIDVKSPGGKDD